MKFNVFHCIPIINLLLFTLNIHRSWRLCRSGPQFNWVSIVFWKGISDWKKGKCYNEMLYILTKIMFVNFKIRKWYNMYWLSWPSWSWCLFLSEKRWQSFRITFLQKSETNLMSSMFHVCVCVCLCVCVRVATVILSFRHWIQNQSLLSNKTCAPKLLTKH